MTNNYKNFVLYYGATFDDRINDMYSFVPCKTVEESRGFSRYVLFDEEKNEGIFKKHLVGKIIQFVKRIKKMCMIVGQK